MELDAMWCGVWPSQSGLAWIGNAFLHEKGVCEGTLRGVDRESRTWVEKLRQFHSNPSSTWKLKNARASVALTGNVLAYGCSSSSLQAMITNSETSYSA
eukprot:2779204-Amphidinium_carterae.1